MEERVEIFKTQKNDVNIIFEFVKGLYGISIENFDIRYNLNIFNEDEDLTRKFCNFLVVSYNEGLVDGKNSAFIDSSLEGADAKLSTREVIEFPTDNKEVIVILEKYEDSDYSIYINSFNQRIEYIVYNKDIELMTKFANSLVKAYNIGFLQGKNEAMYF